MKKFHICYDEKGENLEYIELYYPAELGDEPLKISPDGLEALAEYFISNGQGDKLGEDLVDFIEFLVELEWDELKMAMEEINKAYGNSEIE